MLNEIPMTKEWIETDGRGGYTMSTAYNIRQRRYHGLLICALTPPTQRFMLVGDIEVWVDGPNGTTYLSSHCYAPGVIHPNGYEHIESFTLDPWPRWIYRLADGTRLVHERLIPYGASLIALSWKVVGNIIPLTLFIRPLLAYRNHHELGYERPLDLHGIQHGTQVIFRPTLNTPPLICLSNGIYDDKPIWYHNFYYEKEQARGFDATEDLASPGIFHFDLIGREAALIFATENNGIGYEDSAPGMIARLRVEEVKRRNRFSHHLQRSVDNYLVKRDSGLSIIAGYPWATDWGRDTFIAIRGLFLATNRYSEALQILLTWAQATQNGLVPNRFNEDHSSIDFHAADSSLWFIIAAASLLSRCRVDVEHYQILTSTILSIISAYMNGTIFGIRADLDGLLACGEPNLQLTWMDAKTDDFVVTPRIGKPVEIQALWINALIIAAHLLPEYEEPLARARASFDRRFWYETHGYLYDVVDVDHVPNQNDSTLRVNQIFAIGGLPVALLNGPRSQSIINVAIKYLWTAAGLRTLAPFEQNYAPSYSGDKLARDLAYHQGTVWPYLTGAFIEAWIRSKGDTPNIRREARNKFYTPWLSTVDPYNSGHLPEIADAEPPHHLRGSPFHACSLGEAIRLDNEVLFIQT
ncbi:MAG: glycogen debranching enzyme family protein [Deltaproteobacteria bacterium]|nr:glycogen debranching enzyme family protein [Deltaproteobacteria bacterium]